MSERVVVFISGVWDLLHDGHRNVLEKAAALGDFLVVGVITDRFASAYKRMPVRDFERRCQDVLALPYVDDIAPHDGFDDMTAIDKYKITVRAVGPEYGDYEEQRDCMIEMERRGIRIVALPRTEGVSTSLLMESHNEKVVVLTDAVSRRLRTV
jgi:glycerol-3-phosphate cytidylyltransferase